MDRLEPVLSCIVRNLLLFLLVLCGIWWIRRALNKPGAGSDASPPPGEEEPARGIERMVECAHCGIHVPETESLSSEGRHYCCAAHRVAGPRRPG
jgi:uncharacterized protein